MTQIVIDSDGKVPNVDAMEACIEFAYQNYTKRKSERYKSIRTITTKRNFKVEVEEISHPDKDNSPCSVIFNVKRLNT